MGRSMPISMQSIFRPGDTIFDVGAHVGDKAVMFLASGARVVCFEPQPECANVLRDKYSR